MSGARRCIATNKRNAVSGMRKGRKMRPFLISATIGYVERKVVKETFHLLFKGQRSSRWRLGSWLCRRRSGARWGIVGSWRRRVRRRVGRNRRRACLCGTGVRTNRRSLDHRLSCDRRGCGCRRRGKRRCTASLNRCREAANRKRLPLTGSWSVVRCVLRGVDVIIIRANGRRRPHWRNDRRDRVTGLCRARVLRRRPHGLRWRAMRQERFVLEPEWLGGR